MANMNFWNNGLTPESRAESQQPTQVVCAFTADGMFASIHALGHDFKTSDGEDIDVDPNLFIDEKGQLVQKKPDHLGPKKDLYVYYSQIGGLNIDRLVQIFNADVALEYDRLVPRLSPDDLARQLPTSPLIHPSLQDRPGVDPNSDDYYTQLGETSGD